MTFMIFILLLGTVPLAAARPAVDILHGFPQVVSGPLYAAAPVPPPVKSIVRNPGLNPSQVAAMAKQQCPGCKILSVTSTQRNGSKLYKVKTLSSEGVVRYIFINDGSGSAF